MCPECERGHLEPCVKGIDEKISCVAGESRNTQGSTQLRGRPTL